MRPKDHTLASLLYCALLIVAVPAVAQDTSDRDHADDLVSPYAGQEAREIPALSEEDIRQLEEGEGWGLAKAAELNGVPGPAHLLEMFERGNIHLSGEQVDRIRGLHREMKARAIPLGLRLIEQERELNSRFATADLTDADLQRLLNRIAETTAELRYVHLATHLRTLPVLNAHQVQVYNSIRGYSVGPSESSQDHAHSSHVHQH
jgi:hypothetical protein